MLYDPQGTLLKCGRRVLRAAVGAGEAEIFLVQAVISNCLLWKHVVVLYGQRLDAEFPDSVAKPPVSVGKERLFVLLFHEKTG